MAQKRSEKIYQIITLEELCGALFCVRNRTTDTESAGSSRMSDAELGGSDEIPLYTRQGRC